VAPSIGQSRTSGVSQLFCVREKEEVSIAKVALIAIAKRNEVAIGRCEDGGYWQLK